MVPIMAISNKNKIINKKKNRNLNTLQPYSVKVMMQEIQFINFFFITILKSRTTFKF